MADSPSLSKRQRAFRQRKELHIKQLEEQVRDYEVVTENLKVMQAENYSLRDYIINLQSRLIESQGDYPQPPSNIDLQAQPGASIIGGGGRPGTLPASSSSSGPLGNLPAVSAPMTAEQQIQMQLHQQQLQHQQHAHQHAAHAHRQAHAHSQRPLGATAVGAAAPTAHMGSSSNSSSSTTRELQASAAQAVADLGVARDGRYTANGAAAAGSRKADVEMRDGTDPRLVGVSSGPGASAGLKATASSSSATA